MIQESKSAEAARVLAEMDGNISAAARKIGISRSAMRDRLSRLGGVEPTPDFEMPELPSEVLDYEDLKARSKREFDRYKTSHDARKFIPVKVRIDGPIGIMPTGDPHIDARGCDWHLIDRHTKLVRETDGLYATNVGDLANNWVGRLARLYADQNVTPRESRVMIEGFFRDFNGKLLWVTAGNHDVWSSQDALYERLAYEAATTLNGHGARMALDFPNRRRVVLNTRHDFKGNSQWNITHGPLKAAMMGDRDDIYTCGHLHSGGYQSFIHADERISHIVRLSAYKVLDTYKDENGWRDQNLPACVFVINPAAKTPAQLVQFFADPEAGADYLTFLRRSRRS